MKKSRHAKRKAKGLIKSKKEIDHLLPNKTHREQAETKLVAAYEAKLRIADANIKVDDFRIESLQGGFILDASGCVINEDKFVKDYNLACEKLNHYYRLTEKEDGRLGVKAEHVRHPIAKHTVTTNSRHDQIIHDIDTLHAGNPKIIKEAAQKIVAEWNRASRNERVLWIIVHANAGRLHFHPITTQIDLPKIPDADRKVIRAAKGLDKLLYRNTRLNKASHPGNNRETFTGIPLIAINRLYEDNLWPEDLAEQALDFLDEKIESSFGLPIDFQVCCTLDSFLENEIEKLRSNLGPEIEKAEALHKERVAERVRRHRLDLIASDKDAIKALEEELEQKKRKLNEMRELQAISEQELAIINGVRLRCERESEEHEKQVEAKLQSVKRKQMEIKEAEKNLVVLESNKCKLEAKTQSIQKEGNRLAAEMKQTRMIIDTLNQLKESQAELNYAVQAGIQWHSEEKNPDDSYEKLHKDLIRKLLDATSDARQELESQIATLDSLDLKPSGARSPRPLQNEDSKMDSPQSLGSQTEI